MEYNEAIDELIKQGIIPPEDNSSNKSETLNAIKVINEDNSVIEELESISGIKMSDEQNEILRNHGNMAIIACAGSGKTTMLTNLIAKRIKTKEIKDTSKLVCTTYSKAGAEEMNERLNALLSKLNIDDKIKVVTLHAFFLGIIRTFGVKLDIIKEKDRNAFIANGAREAGLALRDDDLLNLNNLISYQINNLMSDKKALDSQANTLDSMTLQQYAIIRKSYVTQKTQNRLMDYDDMQMYLYKWLVKDKDSSDQVEVASAINVRNYCKYMWTDFYIDEAQDVSKIQYAIIKELVACTDNQNILDRQLVFVGDDDQAIYTWRGADPSIILGIGSQFNLKTFILSTNYRCCRNIVEFASKGINYNSARYAKDMKAMNDGGSIKLAIADKNTLNTASKIAVEKIKELISKNEKIRDIAVLSRNNFHLAILSNMLLKEGIYCVSSDEMKMTRTSMYEDIKSLVMLCGTMYNANVTRNMLWKLCRYMSVRNSNFIAKAQDSCGLSFSNIINLLLMYHGIESEDSKRIKISQQASEQIRYVSSNIKSDTLESLKMIASALNKKDISEYDKFIALSILYLDCTTETIYKRADKARSVKSLANYISQLIKEKGINDTLEYLRLTEQYEQGKYAIDTKDKITLSTIHSAKGKEWKNVIAFACDNISMPSFESINSMLNNGETTAIDNYIDEERRLYYVEVTRAKKDLLIITSPELSVLLLESLGYFNEEKVTNQKIKDYAKYGLTISRDYLQSIKEAGWLWR